MSEYARKWRRTPVGERAMEVQKRRQRAIRSAYNQLANLHPHEWTVLVSRAFEEEGLTVDGKALTT